MPSDPLVSLYIFVWSKMPLLHLLSPLADVSSPSSVPFFSPPRHSSARRHASTRSCSARERSSLPPPLFRGRTVVPRLCVAHAPRLHSRGPNTPPPLLRTRDAVTRACRGSFVCRASTPAPLARAPRRRRRAAPRHCSACAPRLRGPRRRRRAAPPPLLHACAALRPAPARRCGVRCRALGRATPSSLHLKHPVHSKLARRPPLPPPSLVHADDHPPASLRPHQPHSYLALDLLKLAHPTTAASPRRSATAAAQHRHQASAAATPFPTTPASTEATQR